MKLRQAPPMDGMRWMLSGVHWAKSQTFTLLGMMGFMLFGLGLLLALPLVGPLLVGALLPALSVGWVAVVESLKAGRRPTPAVLFSPLAASSRRSMLGLGVAHAAAAALMLWLADLIDPAMHSAWREAMSADIADDARLAAFQALQNGMLLRMVMTVPVALVFWHAPVILQREGGSIARAVFASAVASLRNLSAFVVYGVAWVVADLMLSLLLGGVLALLGLAAWAMFFAMPVALLFSAAFYGSLHASVHGCVDFSGPAAPASDPPAAP